jgi:hypothetical protein
MLRVTMFPGSSAVKILFHYNLIHYNISISQQYPCDINTSMQSTSIKQSRFSWQSKLWNFYCL